MEETAKRIKITEGKQGEYIETGHLEDTVGNVSLGI